MDRYPPQVRKLLLVVSALAFVLTACRAESVTRVRIDPSGTTTVISEIAFDDEALAVIGNRGEDPEDVLRALSEIIDPSALPVAGEGSDVEQFERGDLKGVRVTVEGLDPTQVTERVASGRSILDFVTIGVEDGVLLVAGRTRDIPAIERETFSTLAGGDISSVLDLVLQVEVPGTVTDHNADRIVDGSLLEWDLLPALTQGKRINVFVEATVDPDFQFIDLAGKPFAETPPIESEPGISLWPVVLAIAVAVLVSVLIIRRMQARSRLSDIEGFTPRR